MFGMRTQPRDATRPALRAKQPSSGSEHDFVVVRPDDRVRRARRASGAISPAGSSRKRVRTTTVRCDPGWPRRPVGASRGEGDGGDHAAVPAQPAALPRWPRPRVVRCRPVRRRPDCARPSAEKAMPFHRGGRVRAASGSTPSLDVPHADLTVAASPRPAWRSVRGERATLADPARVSAQSTLRRTVLEPPQTHRAVRAWRRPDSLPSGEKATSIDPTLVSRSARRRCPFR